MCVLGLWMEGVFLLKYFLFATLGPVLWVMTRIVSMGRFWWAPTAGGLVESGYFHIWGIPFV